MRLNSASRRKKSSRKDKTANTFRSSGGPDRAGLAELMTTTPAFDGAFQRVAERASHRSHVATTEESRKLLRRYHPGFGLCVILHCIRSLKDIAQAMSFIQG